MLILVSVIFILAYFVSAKINVNSIKLRPFECGFNSYENRRMPFSTQFFLISLLFLIFDVELIILFPYINIRHLELLINFYIIFFFLLLLTGRVIYEWNQGILE